MPKYEDEIKQKVQERILDLERRDKPARDEQLYRLMKNEMFWQGHQYPYWSESSNRWIVPGRNDFSTEDQDDYDEYLEFSRVVNSFKAHGESIIAALTAEAPSVRFFPEDADKSEDIETAEAFTTIAKLIQSHENPVMLLMKALYIMYLQDFVAAYNHSDEDKKYGMMSETEQTEMPQKKDAKFCSECESWMPMDTGEGEPCSECGTTLEPIIREIEEMVKIDKKIMKPRTGQKIEVFGPRNVKISPFARGAMDLPYVILETDMHIYKAQAEYPEFSISSDDEGDRNRRETFDNHDSSSLATVRMCWLRSWAVPKEAKKDFPTGLKATIIGDQLVSLEPEDMDDSWTFSIDPLSSYINSQPRGEVLIDVQEIKNDLLNYHLKTFRYSISQMFVDSRVLDVDVYAQLRAEPGQILPIKKKPSGEPLEHSFAEIKPASFSRGAEKIDEKNDLDGQVVVGDVPSLHGGPNKGGGGTLGEYQQSRSYALQRLSNPWKVLIHWYGATVHKSVAGYAQSMSTSGKVNLVEKTGNSFVNVWIEKLGMNGRVGKVEVEPSESFPESIGQQRAVLVDLAQYTPELFNQLMVDPNNARVVYDIFGLRNLDFPGVKQRDKQLDEIAQMIQLKAPIPIELEVDDNYIHIACLQTYLASPQGQFMKKGDLQVYESLKIHLTEHIEAYQVELQDQAQSETAPVAEGA